MEYVIYEVKDMVGVITINREKALNALNSQVLEELNEAFDSVDLNTVRCIVLTGAGDKSFVAGADIGEMSTLTKAEGEAFGKKGNDLFLKIEKFPIPVIAAINGFALGGGCEISMSCDIRICSDNAMFGQPEVGLGITPGFGGTQRLARTVGVGMAKQLIYTARNIKADEALRIGLVNAVYPQAELMEQALKGQEVVRQTKSASGPLFTVLVPWMQESVITNQRTVMGFILIQTAAQTVHAAYRGLIWQTVLVAVGMFLLSAAVVFFIARQLSRPLSVMAQAAGDMARGNFEARVPEEGGREIQELARAFNQMTAQLSTLEKSRRDFVANVSHELRSPITSIQGFAQGMLDGTIPPEEHEKYLRVVADETHRLSKLIASLLNLSRMENEETSLAYTDFDVNELARRVLISRMTQIEEKSLEIDVQFAQEQCFVRADADQIQQVIINLLDNAIKFTPEGGAITLSTQETEGHISLRVKDTGIGILPQDAPHIFDRFYKADKAHTVGKGTGLGLAICYRIMERHGQTIRLLQGEGGAEFEITLQKGQSGGGQHGDTGAGEN